MKRGGTGTATARAADARTLYLAPAERVRVTSTGEALVIARDNGQMQRIPVTRLMRIVTTTRVDWSGAALGLCMERAIPVTWIGSTDESFGHLWPRRATDSPLSDALEVLAADDPKWPEAYEHWNKRERLRVLKTWSAERQQAGSPVLPDEWERAKQSWVYRAEVRAMLSPLLHGMAAALVAARLADDGLSARYWGFAREPMEIAEDLTRLIWADMNLCAGPLAAAIERPEESAAIFERLSVKYLQAIDGHLASLHAHVRRRLEG